MEFNDDGSVGGSYQFLHDHVRSLDRTRWAPEVVFFQDNRFVASLRAVGIPVHLWDDVRREEQAVQAASRLPGKAAGALAAIWRRARFLRARGISLLHLNNSPIYGYLDWLPAARLVRIPAITHVMGKHVPVGHQAKEWLARRFDRIIPVSRFIADQFVAEGYDADRMRLIHLGILVDEFRARVRTPAESVRQALGVRPGMVLVVMIGNLREWKGQHVLLEALVHVPAQARDRLHVALAGAATARDQGYADRLRALAAAPPLATMPVQFLGAREDVPDLVNAADIVVHASIEPEPFGLVVTEGMALGRPVIASHFGGPAEILTPETGFVFDPAQPTALAAILARLALDPALRAEVGRAAATRVHEFDTRRLAQRIAAVYDELMPRQAG